MRVLDLQHASTAFQCHVSLKLTGDARLLFCLQVVLIS